LFLGVDRANELLQDAAPMNSVELEDSQNTMEVTEGVVLSAIRGEVSMLSITDLLENILSYVRKQWNELLLGELLRFSVLYGLDAVLKDIVLGKYGEHDALLVNALLPLDNEPLEENPQTFFTSCRKIMYMPPYAMGAILGHSNIVVTALNDLGGKLDVPMGGEFKVGEMREMNHHLLPSEVFYWIFQKNMPDMIKCFVNECGFQFRWIDHKNHLPSVFKRIFEADEYANFPQWAGDADEDELIYESSRERRRLRAASAYVEQMKMLDFLISLGFPFELFFPTENPIECEDKLREEKKLETIQQCRDYQKSLSKEERKVRDDCYKACSAYNYMQESEYDEDDSEEEESEPKTLTLGDFYRQLKARWDGQESAQVAHLDEFEALDSRWRMTLNQQNSSDDNESDYDSASS